MKSKLFMLLAVFYSFYSLAAEPSKTAKVEITATIYDNTCAIDTSSTSITVDLLDAASKNFQVLGYTTRAIPFDIKFSKCSFNADNVKIKFTGTPDNDDTQLLAINTGSGFAEGVAIEILDNNKNRLSINNFQNSYYPIIPGTSNTISYYARMVFTKRPVVPGIVNASANFVFEFE